MPPPAETPPQAPAETPAGGLPAVPADQVIAAVRRTGAANPLLGIGIGPGAPEGSLAAGLCGPDGEGAARALIEAVGRRLPTPDVPVAASMVVLGYAARLTGPALAVLLRDGLLLDLAPAGVRYRFDQTTGFALSLSEPGGWHGPSRVVLDCWGAGVLDGHLLGLVRAVRAVVPMATRLLWGNVASGLTGALAALASAGDVSPQACHATGLALLSHPRLAGSGQLVLEQDRLRFTRRTCCLYYRLPGGGTCGDCPLPTAAGWRHGVTSGRQPSLPRGTAPGRS
jgi:ferric iron reductase protein FhuF